MAGHSKWSKVKHIKAVVDVRRGKLFSKFAKEITVAARLGGGDPDGNPRLRSDVRLIFSKNHGNLASSGSVAYLFQRKGQISIPRESIGDDRLLELALEAGADDASADDEHHVVVTSPDRLYAVGEALKTAGVTADSQKLTYIPDTTVLITDEGAARQVIRRCDALEENDDVQHLHANFDVSEELLTKIHG